MLKANGKYLLQMGCQFVLMFRIMTWLTYINMFIDDDYEPTLSLELQITYRIRRYF